MLALNAGFVDAAGYVALVRLFTAHQSGNSVGLGVALGAGDWTEAWRRTTAIGAFFVGVALGTALVEIHNRRRPARSAASLAIAQIVALGLALGVGEQAAIGGRLVPAQTASYAVAAAALAGSMGLQTVSLRRVAGRTVRTTFVTGMITNIAETLVIACTRERREKARRSRRARFGYPAVLSSVWIVYLGGGVAGATAERAWSFAALSVPLAITAAVAAWDLHVPYQPDMPAPGVGVIER